MAIDAALGRLGAKAGVCTSSTRPVNPFEGQIIYESDTNRTLIYDNSAWLVIADNQVLSIDSTNNRVGIGTTTPDRGLHVDSPTAAVSAKFTSQHPTLGLIEVEGGASTTTAQVGVDGDDIVFRPSQAERMRIDSSGKVGIGTTSPATALEVVGDVYADTGKIIVNRAYADTSTAKGGIDFQIDGSTYANLHQPTTFTLQTDGDFNTLGSLRTKGKKTGLVLVGSADFNNVLSAEFRTAFTTDYDNYQLHLSNVTGAAQEWIYFRGWFGSTLLSTNSYDNQRMYGHITSVGAQKDQQVSYGKFLPMGGNPTSFVVNISSPMKSGAYTLTTAYGLYSDNGTLGYIEIDNTFVRSTAQMDGMRFGGLSGSYTFSGRWELYGCPK